MGRHDAVIWSEGLLLAPQHLQQWDRHVEHWIGERFRAAHAFDWGLTRLELDRDALKNGRIALTAVTGILPDGTPFSAPEQDPLPGARAIEGHLAARQETLRVSLGLPAARPGRPLVGARDGNGQPAPRLSPESLEVADVCTGTDERPITIGRRNLVVLFPDDALGDYDAAPILEVGRQADGTYATRDDYVPPCLAIGASDTLVRLCEGVMQTLIGTSTTLSEKRRVRADAADFAAADGASFLKLHTANAWIPRFAHLVAHRRAHPEQAYLAIATLVGEFCTFSPRYFPKDLPAYDHRALGEVFARLYGIFRDLAEETTKTPADRIELERKEASMHAGRITDPRHVESGTSLFLGVKAEMDHLKLAGDVPIRFKIASQEQIDYILANALPGVRLTHQRTTPARLPAKPDFAYFQLEPSGPVWEGIKNARTVAIFTPPDWPGIVLELLAVRD